MSRATLAVLFTIAAFSIVLRPADGQTTYLSNLTESDDSGFAVRAPGTNDDNSIAGGFSTGAAAFGYNLDSIVVLTSKNGSPAPGISVSVFTDNSGQPGTLVGALTGPTSPVPGQNTYTASGITLSPLTPYWVVMTSVAAGTDPNVFYLWAATQSSNYAASDSWTMNTGLVLGSTNLTTWDTEATGYTVMFSVDATAAVPEPQSVALIASSAGVIGTMALRRRLRR